MKFLLKLLLSLCILIAAIYAATPLWLPQILVRQLPTGWTLEKMETAYPGISGITIKLIRVKGDLRAAGIELEAKDIRFTYKGLKTDTDSVSINAYLRSTEERTADALTLDDLSLPIAELTGRMPVLSVKRLRMALHPHMSMAAFGPIFLNFRGLHLVPGVEDSFRLTSDLTVEDNPGLAGWIDVDVTRDLLTAKARFPASVDSGQWLALRLEQKNQGVNTATQFNVTLDADMADREWLDSVLVSSTNGLLTTVSGMLKAQAKFTGRDIQHIEELFLDAEAFQVVVDDIRLDLDAGVLARREQGKVTATLTRPAEILYQDKTNRPGDLIRDAIMSFHRSDEELSRTDAEVFTRVDSGSSFIFYPGTNQSIEFAGNIIFDYSSAMEVASLRAMDARVGVEDFSAPGPFSADALVSFELKENSPFTYTSDDLRLRADTLSLSGKGILHLDHETIEFEQTEGFETKLESMQAELLANDAWLSMASENFEMQGGLDFSMPVTGTDSTVEFNFDGPLSAIKPLITLPGDGTSEPMQVEADELSVSVKLSSKHGELVTTGEGTFLDGHISPQAASARKIDITWQNLDLLELTGSLSTRTEGFTALFEGESWSGFDVDLSYSMLGNADIDGSGMLIFDTGLQLPVDFSGNLQSERWDITLPDATVSLAQLGDLLPLAHYQLPSSINLADGLIDIQGDVVLDDDVTAELAMKGHDLGASMLESSVQGLNFKFDTVYGDRLSASGEVSVESALLAGGIGVLDIGSNFIVDDLDHFGLRDLHAEVFDGRLDLDSLQYSGNRIEDTTAKLSHISFGQLLAYADVDDLDGSGTLEISLPVGSDQGGFYIRNGSFQSTEPGYIAYTPAGMTATNIGLQALENFQFKDLSGTIDYQSDGTYLIVIHLEGMNPDLYGGHPVDFNLNISGSLPELFEAMFITGDFDRAILNRVRSTQDSG